MNKKNEDATIKTNPFINALITRIYNAIDNNLFDYQENRHSGFKVMYDTTT